MAEMVQQRVVAPARVRKPPRAAAYEPWLWGSLSVALFLLAWEVLSANGLVNSFLVSRPSAIAAAGARLITSGQLSHHLLLSAQTFALGFAFAVLVTVPLGLLLGWWRALDAAVEPLLAALYAVPKVAILPLLLIWVGIGIESKVLMVFIGAFFPLVINVRAGVRSVDRALVTLARSFGASRPFLFRTVILPGSLPFLLTGLRLATARGLVGLVLGELYTGNEGVGYFLTIAGQQYRVAEMFVGILLIAAVSLIASAALTRLERAFDHWRPVVGD